MLIVAQTSHLVFALFPLLLLSRALCSCLALALGSSCLALAFCLDKLLFLLLVTLWEFFFDFRVCPTAGKTTSALHSLLKQSTLSLKAVAYETFSPTRQSRLGWSLCPVVTASKF